MHRFAANFQPSQTDSMKKTIAYFLITATVAVAPLVLSTGCAVTQGREGAGQYAKDKEISARIKTAMYSDPAVKGTQVEVNTLNGVVQLSGFVDNPAEKDRAGQIAASTPGVKQVYNNIVLPTGNPQMGNPQMVNPPPAPMPENR
jgi:hyperosmotically inducible periplasmic protein